MAALRLSNTDRTRRDKLVGMLGSSFDGERLNALELLQRMADSHKAPLHELILANESDEASSSFDRQRAERAEREAREANARAQRAEQAARETQHARPAEPDPDAPKLPPDWRELFADAQQKNNLRVFLTTWETNFVDDLILRGTHFPSPKQAVVILRILAKTAARKRSTTGADWEDIE